MKGSSWWKIPGGFTGRGRGGVLDRRDVLDLGHGRSRIIMCGVVLYGAQKYRFNN